MYFWNAPPMRIILKNGRLLTVQLAENNKLHRHQMALHTNAYSNYMDFAIFVYFSLGKISQQKKMLEVVQKIENYSNMKKLCHEIFLENVT